MELVRRAPSVGEEQEPEPDLGDQERLPQREGVRVEPPWVALSPKVDPAPAEGEEVDGDDEHRVQLVEPNHGGRLALRRL
jgi:hypothetical protein